MSIWSRRTSKGDMGTWDVLWQRPPASPSLGQEHPLSSWGLGLSHFGAGRMRHFLLGLCKALQLKTMPQPSPWILLTASLSPAASSLSCGTTPCPCSQQHGGRRCPRSSTAKGSSVP